VVEKLADMKDVVMTKIQDFIQEKVIIAGIMWLIGLLNPVAAFVKACKAIYDIVMFFIDRATQVGELVNAIVDSVGAIAGGALGEAAGKVENALAKGIPVAIGFLASLLGLGGISDKIRTIIHAIQEPIHNIISKVLGVVLKPFKWIGNKIKQGAAWAKKKLQQGVAFVKTKAKQGVALVKGKVGGLFGRGESEQSQKVKARAHERLAERITHPMANEAQLKAVAAGVLAELRPDGLKELKVRPSRTEEGRYDFLAAASPETPVFEAKTTVSAAEDLHLRQEAKAAVNAAINPIDPDLASVVGKLLDDTDHPLNLVQALMNPERRAKTISLLKELASAQTLAGQSLEDFIKTHPGSGSLFEALPADVNFDAQGRSRKDQYIEQARTKDPTRGNVPEAQQEEMVKQYVTRLLNEVQPAVTKEVDAVAAQVRAEAGGDPEVNVRTKDAAGLLDKVRRMQAKGRKNYGVADIIDAVGARITVDSTAQIATCLQKVRGHFKTGDTGRILEIENFYANPKPGKESYRVIPITVSIQVGGMPYTFELQLTTRRASIAADIEHNVVYKPYVTPSEALEQQGG
jgi:ppGpp synthetase/RelA/SpoT-type nucleotidyltranferase